MRKTYQVIVADPPWSYNYTSVQSASKGGKGCANDHYDTIDNKILQQMPVEKLADPKGCVLFLWSSFALIEDCLAVMNAWGFKYKTAAVWTKHCKGQPEKDKLGVGYWFRSNAEPVLVGIKGPSSIARRTKVGNHFCIDDLHLRTEGMRHSQKPEYLQDLIDEHWDGHKAELFARRNRPNWDCWGDECSDPAERLVYAFGGEVWHP